MAVQGVSVCTGRKWQVRAGSALVLTWLCRSCFFSKNHNYQTFLTLCTLPQNPTSGHLDTMASAATAAASTKRGGAAGSKPRYSVLLPTYKEEENLPIIFYLLTNVFREQ